MGELSRSDGHASFQSFSKARQDRKPSNHQTLNIHSRNTGQFIQSWNPLIYWTNLFEHRKSHRQDLREKATVLRLFLRLIEKTFMPGFMNAQGEDQNLLNDEEAAKLHRQLTSFEQARVSKVGIGFFLIGASTSLVTLIWDSIDPLSTLAKYRGWSLAGGFFLGSFLSFLVFSGFIDAQSDLYVVLCGIGTLFVLGALQLILYLIFKNYPPQTSDELALADIQKTATVYFCIGLVLSMGLMRLYGPQESDIRHCLKHCRSAHAEANGAENCIQHHLNFCRDRLQTIKPN
jgi:hypothetical protein